MDGDGDDLLLNPDENDLMINESILDEDDDEVSTTSANKEKPEDASSSQGPSQDSVLKDVIQPPSGNSSSRKSITTKAVKVPIMKNKVVTTSRKLSSIPRKPKTTFKSNTANQENLDSHSNRGAEFKASFSGFSRPPNANDPRPRLKAMSSSAATSTSQVNVKEEPRNDFIKFNSKKFERMSSGCYGDSDTMNGLSTSTPVSSPPPGRIMPRNNLLTKKPSTASVNSSASSNSPQGFGFKVTTKPSGTIFGKPPSSMSNPPNSSAPGSISGDSKTPFRFGSVLNNNSNSKVSTPNISVESNNPLELLRIQHSRQLKAQKTVDQMDIDELQAVLERKKREAAYKKQLEEEMMMKQLQEPTMMMGDPMAMTSNPMMLMMRQQMALMQQQQREMAESWKMMEKEKERRRMDELQSSINQLNQMMASNSGMRPLAMDQVKGSVKTRVGPKNRLNEGDFTSNIRSRITAKTNVFDDDDQEDKGTKRKYTNSVLPEDLVLTNLTEEGPKPAAQRITWEDEEEVEDYCGWKRRGKRKRHDFDQE